MKRAQDMLLTEEGWRTLREELLSLQERRGSSIHELRDLATTVKPGDYTVHCLQSDIAFLDRRIAQLEEVLSRAVPVGYADREPGTVGVGSQVIVRWEDGEQESYVVVGPPEVDLRAGRISYESPVGRALVGKGNGDWVEVATPSGARRLKVLAVE